MTTAVEVHQEASRMELVALNQPQLEAAHGRMLDWTRGQIAAMRDELQEAEENLAVAAAQRWATESYERRIRIAKRRVEFYAKIEAAIAEGYIIVPNFPMDVFAIRTTARAPRGGVTEFRYSRFPQPAQLLQPGEGEYRNPEPEVHHDTEQQPDGKGGTKTVTLSWPTEYRDIAFPIALAKPALMSKTAEVMAQKLFDEIGVAQDRTTGGDPMILGRLLNPRRGRPAMTFFIGWYFDPSRV